MSLDSSGISVAMEIPVPEEYKELEMATVLLPNDTAVSLHSRAPRGTAYAGKDQYDFRHFYYLTIFDCDSKEKINIHTVRAIAQLRNFLDGALHEIDLHAEKMLRFNEQYNKESKATIETGEEVQPVLERDVHNSAGAGI